MISKNIIVTHNPSDVKYMFYVKHIPSILPSDATTDDIVADFNMFQVVRSATICYTSYQG